MKIILEQDVPKVGLKGEIKEVSSGYARNYLFPNKLAKEATRSNINELKRLQEIKNRLHEKQEKEAMDWVKNLSGKVFELKVEVGEKGQLFQAVDAEMIAKVLTENDFPVEKTKIIIDKPFKELGEFEFQIKLMPEIVAKTKLKIIGR
jgi:large subunit ribosomal protein L9